jgi:hypothetical protein
MVLGVLQPPHRGLGQWPESGGGRVVVDSSVKDPLDGRHDGSGEFGMAVGFPDGVDQFVDLVGRRRSGSGRRDPQIRAEPEPDRRAGVAF